MKKIFSILALGCLTAFGLTSCMDQYDEPAPETNPVTSPVSVGEVNSTILAVKEKYCASSSGADFTRNSSNFFSRVNEDLVIEGVIVANDNGGNLYQTIIIRNIDTEAGTDQCLQLGIKNTCLYPYFALGQRIKINLKGLYAGCYSQVPKIGQPYYSSQGNLNLGPMLLQMCATNIELVGNPDLNAPELIPEDFTDGNLPSRGYQNVPKLATVKGLIAEVQGNKADEPAVGEITKKEEPLPKMFAPEVLHDLGYGVDRTIQLSGGNKKVTLRTSTQNDIAFTLIPSDERSYTGMLTNYSGEWQIQLRHLNDINPRIGAESENNDENK